MAGSEKFERIVLPKHQILTLDVRGRQNQFVYGQDIPSVLIEPKYPNYGSVSALWHRGQLVVNHNGLRDLHLHIQERRITFWPVNMSATDEKLPSIITVVPGGIIYHLTAIPELAEELIKRYGT